MSLSLKSQIVKHSRIPSQFLSQSPSLISFLTQKFFASQVLCTWLAVSQGSAQADKSDSRCPAQMI
jgi:hypothetical protein